MAGSKDREKVGQLIADMRAFDASLDLLDASVAGLFGISRSDLRAMECVSRGGRVTSGNLATALRLTTGSVTALVDRMELAGLLRRVDNPDDRRSVMVELTPKGREQERRAFGGLASDSAKALSRYDGRALAVISDFLRTATKLTDAARARIAGHGRGRRSTRGRAGRR